MKIFIFYWVVILFFTAPFGFASSEVGAFGTLEYRNACRLKAFNATPNAENKIDQDWWGLIDKNDVIREYTTEIDESLSDDSEFLAGYACANKTELLFKSIMGSVLVDKEYSFDKSKMPTHLFDPLYLYYKVIDQIVDLSRDLFLKIRTVGYTPVDISDLDYDGIKYSVLFRCSGVARHTFARWFNEVFKEHEPGFRMQYPNLSIHSYNPSEHFVGPNNRLSFDPRCNHISLCDHADVFEIFDDEIEACYNKRYEIGFRAFKLKLAAAENNKGGINGALGRRFGNPDKEDLPLDKKEAIEASIRDYLNARRSLYSHYLKTKEADYLEVDLGEEAVELSANARLALDNMKKNAQGHRF